MSGNTGEERVAGGRRRLVGLLVLYVLTPDPAKLQS
jgi:hypothetical protein